MKLCVTKYSTVIFVAIILIEGTVFAAAKPQTLKSGQQGYYNVAATYPKFSERTKVARETNRLILRWVRKEQQRFVKETRKTLESLGMPTAPYWQTIDYIVRHTDTTAFMSIQCEVSEYTGGAHANSSFVVFNVGIVNGKAARVTLADFFSGDTTYRSQLSDTLLSRLKQDDRATFVRDGLTSTLTNKQLELFVVQQEGLLFLFNRYDVAPYTAGTFSVKLSFEELGARFNREMVSTRVPR